MPSSPLALLLHEDQDAHTSFPSWREWGGNQQGFLLQFHHRDLNRSPQLSKQPPSREPRQLFGGARCLEAEHPRVSLLQRTIRRGISRPPASRLQPQIGGAASCIVNLLMGVNPRPPGGFLNYFCMIHQMSLYPQQPRNQHVMAQNFHFVGGPLPCAPFQPSVARGIPSPSLAKERTPLQPSRSQRAIDVDSGDEDGDVRTEKRLTWTKDEDERLMSAWLYNSNDPINGNNKKSDQYWGDVARVYNNTTPKNRKRNVKQAKDHWHSLNKLVYQFHCCYTKASAIYASGQSDAQLIEKAYKFYADDYKGQFHHYDCWKAVNEWPKWRTYNEWLENSKKRKTSDAGEAGKDTSSPKDAEDILKPMGTKAAKAEHNGKGKSKEVASDMELLEKLVAAQAKAQKTRSEVIEVRKRVSTEKLEIARLTAETTRLSAETAKDNIEARKLDKEAEMMRAYRALLVQDTIGMTDEMKNEHVKTLKVMRERLFGV